MTADSTGEPSRGPAAALVSTLPPWPFDALLEAVMRPVLPLLIEDGSVRGDWRLVGRVASARAWHRSA